MTAKKPNSETEKMFKPTRRAVLTRLGSAFAGGALAPIVGLRINSDIDEALKLGQLESNTENMEQVAAYVEQHALVAPKTDLLAQINAIKKEKNEEFLSSFFTTAAQFCMLFGLAAFATRKYKKSEMKRVEQSNKPQP